ncbi:hypothetical protein DYH09_25180 [bacterium CPR1]|nr:hypothetical protein [bacterium CPR1]MCG3141097.1 hypothetical protein [Anaerolineae bacterium]
MSLQLIGKANRIPEDPEQMLGELDKRKLKGLEGDTVKFAFCPPDKLPVSVRKLDESQANLPDFFILVMSEDKSAARKTARATGKSVSGGKA